VAELRTLSGHTSSVHAVAVTRTGSACGFCVAGRDAEGVGTGERARVGHLTGHSDRVRAVAVNPDRQRAVSASDDETLKVWELNTG
jgi:WD40 repeat protein